MVSIINAILRVTLYQDLTEQSASSVEHQQSPPYESQCHEVVIVEGTPLYELLYQKEISVNSYHHQAMKRLPPKLQA